MRAAIVVLVVMFAPRVAEASCYGVSHPYETRGPSVFDARGHAPPRIVSAEMTKPCDGDWLRIVVEGANPHLGHQVHLVASDVPIAISREPVTVAGRHEIHIPVEGWDGRPFDARITVSSIDREGRGGPASAPYLISHGGTAGWWAVLGLLVSGAILFLYVGYRVSRRLVIRRRLAGYAP